MANEPQAKLIPPYLPYKTLMGSLENLAQGIPPKLDRSIWKNQPGTVQSQILSAYKFLGLMNDSTEPTEMLRVLVEHRSSPTPVMKHLIEDKYKAILDKHPLNTMTITMLNNEFEVAFQVDGETKKKGIRFLLQAAKANGFVLSKFLLDQTRVSSGPRKKRGTMRDSEQGGTDGEDDAELENTSTGTKKTIALRSGGQLGISLSVDLFALSVSDRKFVFSLIDSLQEYETKGDSEPLKKASVTE
jgi:hypothetical protein